jgi:GT2 family glycosyltransferase
MTSPKIINKKEAMLLPSVSVIIITLNRPDYLNRCLNCLVAQNPDQMIVIDSSPNNKTKEVVDKFSDILYIRNENGIGKMTASRNIGLKHATGDIIAFLDDDAFAKPGWLKNLLETYNSQDIGAVGGRALNNLPGEEKKGVNEIGKFTANGEVTGNFGANPEKIIETDHIMGCNMSFRREILLKLGGFREEFYGTGLFEDTDMCLRVRALGYKILFNPFACVEHAGAPQFTGKRFDLRYEFYGQKNHQIMLIRNFGLKSSLLWRHLFINTFNLRMRMSRHIFKSLGIIIMYMSGTVAGFFSGIRILIKTGINPIRRDKEAEEIREKLKTNYRGIKK